MTLPNFIVIGAAKAGTTSLASYLKSHPDIALSSRKEPHFFTKEYDRGVAWYEELFVDCAGALAIGEASTSYTMAPQHPEAPGRIAELVPDARLIYVLRHPVDRVRSQYAHNLDRALERKPLSEAIRQDPSYLDATRYAYQLSRFRDHFPDDQIHVVVSEQLRHDRSRVLAGILEFLGVDASVELTNTDHELNRMADKRLAPPAVNATRRVLRSIGVNRLLPKTTRQRLRVSMSQEMPDQAVSLAAEDRDFILDSLADDLADLAGLLGPALAVWDLQPRQSA